MKYISFPGLGIESLAIDRVAFTVFGVDVMWYGILITVGMILAYLYGITRAKIERVKTDDITDLTLFLIIFGVIGARLYYIAFKPAEFIVTNPSGGTDIMATLKAVINVRSGGLAIYGGIIAGVITAIVFAKRKKIRIPVLLDILAPSVMVGQVLGRWGNFMNVEAYGSDCDLPWRMGVGFGGGAPYVHPTFFYESLWNLIGLALITAFYKKKKFHGQIVLFYAIWYGAGRAFIEGLRSDSLMVGPFRVSQLLSVVICVASVILMVIGMNKVPRVSYVNATDDSAENNNAEGAVSNDADADEALTEEKHVDAESEEVIATEDKPSEEENENG